MRIVIYGLNYAPELTGIGRYTGDLGAWLTGRGHQVRVITAPPYYPAWRVRDDFRATSYRIEHNPGEPTVFRVPLWVPSQPNGWKRLVHLFSFALSSAPVLLIQPLWQPDVIFAVEPTFFAAPLALLTARFCGAASWLHIQDFEVDAAFELGLLPPGGLLHRIATALERTFTAAFDRVSTLSPRMVDRLAAKNVPTEHRVLFPNWVSLPALPPAQATAAMRRELGLGDQLIVLYSGNLGAKQGLEILAPLAGSFASDPHLHFVFCGDGAFRPQLEAAVADLPNVTLLPLQPPERLGTLLRMADLHLLPQRAGAADLVMPSKLTGMLASGRPVVATAKPGTQIASVVQGRGLIVEPANLAALHNAVRTLADNADLRDRFGTAARHYAQEHLEREKVLLQFENDLIALLHEGQA